MSDQAQYHTAKAVLVNFVQTTNDWDQYQVQLDNGVSGFSYMKNGNQLNFSVGTAGKFQVTLDRSGNNKIKYLKENSGEKGRYGKGGYGKSKEEIALNSATALVSNLYKGQSIDPKAAAGLVTDVATMFKAWLNAGNQEQQQPQPQVAQQQNFNPQGNIQGMIHAQGPIPQGQGQPPANPGVTNPPPVNPPF